MDDPGGVQHAIGDSSDGGLSAVKFLKREDKMAATPSPPCSSLDAVNNRIAVPGSSTLSDDVAVDALSQALADQKLGGSDRGSVLDDDDNVTIFCCSRCRCALFTNEQLSSQHGEGQHVFSYRRRAKESASARALAGPKDSGQHNSHGLFRQSIDNSYDSRGTTSSAPCTSLFLSEPNQWMSQATTSGEAGGKLLCPKCKSRVGSFCWAGSQCSCGTWIAPALQFPVSKLDERVRSKSQIPEHVRSPPPVIEPVAQQEDDVKEGEANEIITGNTTRELSACEKGHAKWIESTNKGDGAHCASVLLADATALATNDETCSLTTVQKKQYEGHKKVSAVLSKSSSSLAGRITLLQGPLALPAPSTSTRVLFKVDGVKGMIGETLVWFASDDGPKVHHVIRVKDPCDQVFLPSPV